MGVKLMTGATGEQNIQAADDRECLAGVTGLDSYVFPTAGRLAASLTDSNTLTIGTGAGSLQGARFRCPTTTAVTIENGTQAQHRRDVVGLRFSRASTGKESLTFEVLAGEPASTEAGAADPTYDEGDLLAGDAEAFMPLYRVKLSGINVSEPEAMFSVLTPLSDLRDSVSRAEASIAALSAVSYGTASNTDQVDSSTGVTWVKVGRAVTFRFWVKFKYYQGSYDITPALATGMPRPTGDTDHCGVGLIDGKDGCVLAKVTASGEFKVTRRSATVDANGIVCGFGTYLSAS